MCVCENELWGFACFCTYLPSSSLHLLPLRSCVKSVHCGLCVIVCLLSDSDLRQKLKEEWGLPGLVKTLQKHFPDFSTRNKLLSQIASAFPDDVNLCNGLASVTKEMGGSGRDVPQEIIEKEVNLFVGFVLSVCKYS